MVIEELLKIKAKNSDDLSSAKRRIARLKKISCPSNIALLKSYHNLVNKKRIKPNPKLALLLRTRPIRSLAGVVNVSVLTKPYRCPGKCLYCPTETGIPKSYVSGEPAVERAKKLNFDPYEQTAKRIEVLEISGHPIDKIDIRVIGGTWSYYPKKYRLWFCKKCFDACNKTKNDPDDKNLSEESLWKKLAAAQKKNETAKCRVVGMSFETRPDFVNPDEAAEMQKMGATKIELGVQSIYEYVLALNLRGAGNKETANATKILKDAGFKVAYQMMLNLYGSTPSKDIKMFKEIFNNPDYKPDYLKIYPCALIKEAALHKKYLNGKYKPYKERTLINTIKAIKKIVPRYVRIERIIRDIPSSLIIESPDRISNLRQIVAEEMEKENTQCECIRCREIRGKDKKEKTYLFREDYEASGGREILLSFENKTRKNLYSLLRLRIPSQLFKKPDPAHIWLRQPAHKDQTLKNCAIIRELHTYGQAAEISGKDSLTQHRGMGQKLIKEAEKIAEREFGIKKIAVISGAGVRDYYRQKLGYKFSSGYMIKSP